MLLALFSSKLATAMTAIDDAYVSALVAASLATVTAANPSQLQCPPGSSLVVSLTS